MSLLIFLARIVMICMAGAALALLSGWDKGIAGGFLAVGFGCAIFLTMLLRKIDGWLNEEDDYTPAPREEDDAHTREQRGVGVAE